MRAWMVLVTVAVLLVMMTALAAAQDALTNATLAATAAAAAQEPVDVGAGGTLILRLRVTVSGITPSERATILYNRLNNIMSDRQVMPEDVKTVQKGDEWLIVAGPYLFITATPTDADANKTTPMKLAQIWASNLRIAIATARPVAGTGEALVSPGPAQEAPGQ